MPYSNSIPITPNALDTIAVYLADTSHKHHQEYELTPIEIIGTKSVQDFIKFAQSAFRANKRPLGRIRKGRQPTYAATWIVVRTPDGTMLTDNERLAYEAAARAEAGNGSPVVGLMNWHKNRLTGAADLNLLAAAFTATGNLVRDRTRNPIMSLRHRMDQVTEALNVLRKQRGIPLIQTMQEAQKKVRKQRKTFVIEDVLFRMPKPPLKAADLKPALLSIGCEVPRSNIERDTISIIKPSKKKGKAKRYSITELLHQIRSRLSSVPPPTWSPQPERFTRTTGRAISRIEYDAPFVRNGCVGPE